MAEEQNPSLMQRFGDWVAENHAQQPDLGGQMEAMGREMLKDVRGELMETFFGSAELSMESGVPLSPTPQMVTQDLGMGSFENAIDQYAARGSVHGQDQDQGIER